MEGLCECGCGHKTKIATQTRADIGHVKGQPVRFLQGHWVHTQSAHDKLATHRKTSLAKLKRAHLPSEHGDGYLTIHDPQAKKPRLQHRVMAERALGRPLKPTELIHHINEDRADNRNDNFVICQGIAYHALLHQRERAYRACGQAHWRKCAACKQYDAPENLYIPKKRGTICHRSCLKTYGRKRAH